MKSKKIVALALTAAMAISMASMTAFAGGDSVTCIIGNKAANQKTAMESSSGPDNNKTITIQYVVGFRYDVMNSDGTKVDQKRVYAFKKANGSNPTTTSETDADGNVTTTIVKNFSAAELDNVKDATYEFSFDKIKDSLPKYTARGYKHVGWDLTGAYKKPDATAMDAGDVDKTKILDSSAAGGPDCDCGVTATFTNDAESKDAAPLFTLYPVWQKMTAEEKAKERNEETDVAVDPKTNNMYKGYEVHTIPKEMGYTEGESALEACKAKSVMSRIYDIKPYGNSSLYDTDGADGDDGVVVKMLDHQKTEVKLSIPDECKKDKGQWKNLKLFHVDSKGKATQLKITIDENDKVVKAKTGDFSTFVLTWDPRSITTDSEGNPATGEASALPVALLAVAALSATGVVAYKKRKAE